MHLHYIYIYVCVNNIILGINSFKKKKKNHSWNKLYSNKSGVLFLIYFLNVIIFFHTSCYDYSLAQMPQTMTNWQSSDPVSEEHESLFYYSLYYLALFNYLF